MSNMSELDCSTAPAALRAVLLHRPDAHPIWHTYMLSIVHLRPISEAPPAILRFSDSSHEIAILALDPDCSPYPHVARSVRPLMPPNLAHQIRGRTDQTALTLFGAFVTALSSGELNPDTDACSSQIEWLERWGKAS